MTPILLADDVGPGGTAFFIVLALVVVTIGIFFAMFGSLKRLKQSVAKGNFGSEFADPSAASDSDSPTTSDKTDAATPDPGGRGGVGV